MSLGCTQVNRKSAYSNQFKMEKINMLPIWMLLKFFSGISKIIDSFQGTAKWLPNSRKHYLSIQIENKPQKNEIDSGADCILIPK